MTKKNVDAAKPTETTEGKNFIVFREPIIEDGVQGWKEHGPIPVEDWPAYEKENGL